MGQSENGRFVEFECTEAPVPEGTPAAPRPVNRPRETPASAADGQASFQEFDCAAANLAPATKAAARPQGRERQNLNGIPSATDAGESSPVV
jgi:hypothetical protein